MNINEYLNKYKIDNVEYETYIAVQSTFQLPDAVNVNKVLDVFGSVFVHTKFKMQNILNVRDSLVNYNNITIIPGTYVGDDYYKKLPDVFNSKTFLRINGYFTESGILS